MPIAELFNVLKSKIIDNTYSFGASNQDRVDFIVSRCENLAKEYANEYLSEQANKLISNYLSHSAEGVFTFLAKAKDANIMSSVISILNESPQQFQNIKSNTLNIAGDEATINSYTLSTNDSNISLIVNSQNPNQLEAHYFADHDELHTFTNKLALTETINAYKDDKITPEQLFKNLLDYVPSKQEALKELLSLPLTPKIDELITKEFNVSAILDKSLRQNQATTEFDKLALNYLITKDQSEHYIHSRLHDELILPKLAKDKLSQAVEELKQNPIKLHTTPILDTLESGSSYNQFNFKKLAFHHETLFSKIKTGEHFYWTDKNQMVNIHPEKISIPKLSRDAVELALDAAITGFGNNLNIKGSDAFKSHVVDLLVSNEKYVNVTLTNPDLQAAVDAKREVNVIEAPTQDQDISQSTTPKLTTETQTVKPQEMSM